MGKILYIILAIIASLVVLFLKLSIEVKTFICLAFVVLGCIVRGYDKKQQEKK